MVRNLIAHFWGKRGQPLKLGYLFYEKPCGISHSCCIKSKDDLIIRGQEIKVNQQHGKKTEGYVKRLTK